MASKSVKKTYSKSLALSAIFVAAIIMVSFAFGNVFASEQLLIGYSAVYNAQNTAYDVELSWETPLETDSKIALFEVKDNKLEYISCVNVAAGQTGKTIVLPASAKQKIYYAAITLYSEQQLALFSGKAVDTSLDSFVVVVNGYDVPDGAWEGSRPQESESAPAQSNTPNETPDGGGESSNSATSSAESTSSSSASSSASSSSDVSSENSHDASVPETPSVSGDLENIGAQGGQTLTIHANKIVLAARPDIPAGKNARNGMASYLHVFASINKIENLQNIVWADVSAQYVAEPNFLYAIFETIHTGDLVFEKESSTFAGITAVNYVHHVYNAVSGKYEYLVQFAVDDAQLATLLDNAAVNTDFAAITQSGDKISLALADKDKIQYKKMFVFAPWAGEVTNSKANAKGILLVASGDTLTIKFEKIASGTTVKTAVIAGVPAQIQQRGNRLIITSSALVNPAMVNGKIPFTIVLEKDGAQLLFTETIYPQSLYAGAEYPFFGYVANSTAVFEAGDIAVNNGSDIDNTYAFVGNIVKAEFTVPADKYSPAQHLLGGNSGAPQIKVYIEYLAKTGGAAKKEITSDCVFATPVSSGENIRVEFSYKVTKSDLAEYSDFIIYAELESWLGNTHIVRQGKSTAITVYEQSSASFVPSITVQNVNYPQELAVMLLENEIYVTRGNTVKAELKTQNWKSNITNHENSLGDKKTFLHFAGQKIELVQVRTEGSAYYKDPETGKMCFYFVSAETALTEDYPTEGTLEDLNAYIYKGANLAEPVHGTGAEVKATKVIYIKNKTSAQVEASSFYAPKPNITHFAKEGSTVTATFTFSNMAMLKEGGTLFGGVAAKRAHVDDNGDLIIPENGVPYFYPVATKGENRYKEWKLVYTVPQELPAASNLIDNAAIAFAGSGLDVVQRAVSAGSSNIAETEKQVIYYAPISFVPEITVDSNIKDPLDGVVVVRDNNTVTMQFATGHPVDILEAALVSGGKKIPAKSWQISTDGLKQQAVFVFNADDVNKISDSHDLEVWSIYITVQDIFEEPFTFSEKDTTQPLANTVRYYAPIKLAQPVLLVSTNEKDRTKFAKNGDVITIKLVLNHWVTNIDTDVNNENESVFADSEARTNVEFIFEYTINQGDLQDLSMIEFDFVFSDIAGNISEIITQEDAENKIKYYAPIEYDANAATDNPNAEFAKNGDTVTVGVAANHEVISPRSFIGGASAAASNLFMADMQVSYTIPQNEGAMAEGGLPIVVFLEDPAGNTKMFTEKSKDEMLLVYDRTAPKLTVGGAFRGFTNTDITFSFMYADDYLSASDAVVVKDGIKQNNAAVHTGAQVFNQTISLSQEGEYKMLATAQDVAGNSTDMDAIIHVIVDKTGPKINIAYEKNTYATGFVLQDIFYVEEEYVKNVVCSLADLFGVQDWDLAQPIETEGAKTAYLLVQDLAGNVSVPVTYDFYIDATAPKIIIVDTSSGQSIHKEMESTLVGDKATLEISLADTAFAAGYPDEFTKLHLLDSSGEIIVDLMSGNPHAKKFTLNIAKHGNYMLVVQAVDNVGNTLNASYTIVFRQKTLPEILFGGMGFAQWVRDNPPRFFVSAAFAVSFVVCIAYVAVRLAAHIKKKHRKF